MSFLKSIFNNQKIKLLLILLFFITIPLKNSFNSISIILLLTYTIVNYKSFKLKVFKSYFPLLSYYVLVLASLLYTIDVKNGFDYLLLYVPFIVFPFVFSVIKLTNKELKWIFKFYTYWLILLILFSEIIIGSRILNENESLFLMFRKDYSYIVLGNVIGIHPPYMVLMISFVMFYIISQFKQTGINKIFQIFILLLFLFYIIHLSSRLPMALIILISFVLIFNKLKSYYSLQKVISILLLILITTSFFFYSIRSTRYRFLELVGIQYANGVYIKSAPSKIFQWSAAIKANENIIIGNGAGDANKSIIKSNSKQGLYRNAYLKYNAHNQYLQTYVGLGALGVFCLIYFLLYFLVMHSNPFLKTASLAFIIYLSISFLTESYLERHHGVVFISFILCLVYKKSSSNS